MAATPQDVLDYWFGDDVAGGSWQQRADIWFGGGDAVDAEITARFGDTLSEAGAGKLDDWAATPHGALALVIVLDQFSRNIHRGRAAAFAHDAKALALVRNATSQGFDEALLPIERQFLYMPLMHAEDVAAQEECLARLHTLAEIPGPAQETIVAAIPFAEQHLEIIRRFGRFPHRNVALARASTPEEKAFMAAGGPSFGQTPPGDEPQST